MILISLETRDGSFVTNCRIPPMNPPPEIVGWGARMFVQHRGTVYREGIIWYVTADPADSNPAA